MNITGELCDINELLMDEQRTPPSYTCCCYQSYFLNFPINPNNSLVEEKNQKYDHKKVTQNRDRNGKQTL